jgi:dTDP-glucose 4,6-dehydratase
MSLPKSDLQAIMSSLQPSLLDNFRNKRLFITGGTGFFGRWLLEFFYFANATSDLNCKVCVLTRDEAKFFNKAPHFATAPAFTFMRGNISSFEFPKGEFDFLIHAATEADTKLNFENPLLMVDTIVSGTRRVLEFAAMQPRLKMIFVSSGAVYGRQPSDMSHISELYAGSPDTMSLHSAYGEAKRMAEFLCNVCASRHNIKLSVARCFAFVGPLLPLDMHFAVGNFIANCLKGQPIIIKGDGTTVRSYMYSADLVIWLLTILVNGKQSEVYNVGSDQTVTIKGVAEKIKNHFSGAKDIIVEMQPSIGRLPERYVPLVEKAKNELALSINFDLDTALLKTVAFYKNINN